MPSIIVSTCGTSLLTNGVPDELRSLLHRTANQQAEEMKPEEKALIDTLYLCSLGRYSLDFNAVSWKKFDKNEIGKIVVIDKRVK